jgi:hypothetical protein
VGLEEHPEQGPGRCRGERGRLVRQEHPDGASAGAVMARPGGARPCPGSARVSLRARSGRGGGGVCGLPVRGFLAGPLPVVPAGAGLPGPAGGMPVIAARRRCRPGAGWRHAGGVRRPGPRTRG